ncbi:unnamed protein product [Caenorhabditis angaria]|uniref:Uncharacterized protein n=1 Tax=Caenorhabditis angaria TaxID=860376 RepID=A0A9P1N3I1_9PELO|nr:unnamed protein product [Caenorhabditis angaria]
MCEPTDSKNVILVCKHSCHVHKPQESPQIIIVGIEHKQEEEATDLRKKKRLLELFNLLPNQAMHRQHQKKIRKRPKRREMARKKREESDPIEK